MGALPANLSRVPNMLANSLLLGAVTRTNLDLLNVQTQLTTGRKVAKVSDDAVAASAIGVLNQRLAVGAQVQNNLDSADSLLSYLDTSLGDATDVVQGAKSIASGQIGVGSDRATRATQAVVVDGMLKQLFDITNRSYNGVYLFGGATGTRAPMVEVRGGFRYTGRGSGLLAELGPARDVPVNIGVDAAIGNISARVRSQRDLDPALTAGARLADLDGARGLGISPGTVQFRFDGGPVGSVDLAGADTVGDVLARLDAAIRAYETANGVTVLGPGGVGVVNGSISVDVVPGTPPALDPALTFNDIGSGTTAQDLGLSQAGLTAGSPAGVDVRPRLTLQSPVTSLSGVTVPLGTVRVRFTSGAGSSFTDVDLSGAQTIDDIRDRIETAAPGVRVQINAARNGIDVLNEVSGPALSIEPTGVGMDTAFELGIRSLSPSTRMSDFNDGRGVRIVDGAADPQTGTFTRALNRDFRVFLGNGQAFDVDLRPQDMTDAASVMARIQAEFDAAVGQPPLIATAPALAAGQVSVQLSGTGNGLQLVQTGVTGAMRVEKLNNSAAAEDLGMLSGTYDAGSASFTAQDRSGVSVDNIFTALVRLRDALRNDDSAGISLAGESLDTQVDRLAQTQALVGVYANRVSEAAKRQEDENVLNEKLRSQLQDTDYAEASVRFSLLQTQLQAALRTGAQASTQTLLDFLR
jgi:flagellar hook-associated protein 3 FlgL